MNVLVRARSGRTILMRTGLFAVSLLLAGYSVTILSHKAEAAACGAPAANYGVATTTMHVDSTATYQIWSHMAAADTGSNSYFLEVDGNTCYVIGDSNNLVPGTWTWVDYQNGSTTASKARQTLSAGDHALKMIGREPGVKLGRILFVSDLNCVPANSGDNCAIAGDTEAPSIGITAPQPSTFVSGTVNIAAAASDNVSVTRVEFYVGGVLKSTDTSAPFSYTWDSKAVANGTVSLMAKAYDAAGNTNSDTVQVQVANGDTQAPTMPGGVMATANAYNQVTLTWSASTDNTGIAGYRVAKNGVTVAEVTNATRYVDNAVLPNIAYTYQVAAYDAAGNTSMFASPVQVRTPNQPDTEAPSVPGNLQATAVSASQINLSWASSTDNIGIAAYDVYRSVGGGSAVKVASVTSVSYGDSGLAASTNYAYYIVARDSAGNTSQQSATVAAQTSSIPPAATTGVLKGRVAHKPLRGSLAQVVVRVNGAKRTFTADRSGNYYIAGLPPGKYKIRYQARGSATKEVTVKIEVGKTKTQNVTLRRR